MQQLNMIMRDVNEGWILRYSHANMASFFFIAVYLHISRGLYYGSYRSPRIGVWVIGTIIFFLMMATAFLGYVLPYGQMSLWGATVITNLLSAIPWLGKSLVESIIKNKKNILFIIYFSLNNIISKLYILYYKLEIFNALHIIGKLSPYALKRIRKERLDKNQYLNISYTFLSMLIGLIDGDGYICISKTKKKYIKMSLVISLDIKDLFLLEYIRFHLKLGIINTYPKNRKKHMCKLVINKTDLQNIFFPLLKHHNLFFLTEIRSIEYNKALFILHNNIKFYSDIPLNITWYKNILKKSKDYLNLDFFDNWIVGFTIAEGSFFIKKNKDACFQLKQGSNPILFKALKLKFKTNRRITTDNSGKYNQFSVSKKEDIQVVINFFSFSGNHPLIGFKLTNYNNWLVNLQRSERYKNLEYPN